MTALESFHLFLALMTFLVAWSVLSGMIIWFVIAPKLYEIVYRIDKYLKGKKRG